MAFSGCVGQTPSLMAASLQGGTGGRHTRDVFCSVGSNRLHQRKRMPEPFVPFVLPIAAVLRCGRQRSRAGVHTIVEVKRGAGIAEKDLRPLPTRQPHLRRNRTLNPMRHVRLCLGAGWVGGWGHGAAAGHQPHRAAVGVVDIQAEDRGTSRAFVPAQPVA